MESEMKLPLGFRFHPTDEELIVHYLRRKLLSIPLPAPAVSDFDVFHTHPSLLPGDLKGNRYFFSEKKWNKTASGITIISCNDFGYWKENGKEEIIVIPGTNQPIGKKKHLVFYETHQKKTKWFMELFSLFVYPSIPNSLQRCMIEIDDWVVTRIYQRRSKAKNKGVKSRNKKKQNGLMDILTVEELQNENELGPPQPSSSSDVSSCNVAATASHKFQEQEEEACSAAYI